MNYLSEALNNLILGLDDSIEELLNKVETSIGEDIDFDSVEQN